MVMPSKCMFCGKTYGDAEQHACDNYVEYIIDLGKNATKQLTDFTKTINEQSEAALKILQDMRNPDGTKFEV